MFDIANLSNELIDYYWKRAELCAQSVWTAHCLGADIGQAKFDQQWLRQWVKEAKEAGLVYNGQYDEFISLKL